MQRTLLVADGSQINQKLLARILSDEYRVKTTDNGREALALLRQDPALYSAVLLDIVMPVMDGYETLAQIRGDSALSSIPVIVTTEFDKEGAEAKALSLGANDYIVKPYDPAVIKHRLWNTVNLRETAALANAARKDDLTGLYNRGTFFAESARLIAAHEPGYYVMSSFDIDSFKVINDLYGTEKGDSVLQDVANVFREGFRDLDGICCRVMADNFAVLYPARYMESRQVAKIRENASRLDGSIQPISFSIGRYIVDDLSMSPNAIYDRATLAEDSVKGRYDQNIALYDESMRRKVLQQQEIVSDMRRALEGGQFVPYLQPQYNHASGALVGAEALVRWRHPEKGLISPAEFIPVFERNGFVYELDKYIWEQVCRILRRWIDEGRHPLPISVNVSRVDILRPDFLEVITGLVERYQIPVSLLELEITESALAQSADEIIRAVQSLTGRGFTVEIDDFGSGYSSLNTLKDVPANVLKLDMRFLQDEGNSTRGGNILESVVRMARWLGMTVIAEGVETRTQADFLSSIGCFYVQGYLYARPMPVAEYEKLAASAKSEPPVLSMETVENLDNNAFWNPASMETLIFNSYVGGACIFEVRGDAFEVLRVNEKYAQELGGSNMTVEDAIRFDVISHMDETSQAALQRAMRQIVQSSSEAACEIALNDLPGGTTYLRLSMRAIARAGARVLCYCSVFNLTALRVAQQKEQALSEQIRVIMDNVNSGVVALTMEQGVPRLVFSNAQFYSVLGYTKRQFVSEVGDLFLSIKSIDRARVRAQIDTLLETKAPGSFEFRCVRRDGEEVTLRCSASVSGLTGVGGAVLLAVLTDISSIVSAQMRIVQSSEQLRFLNETAHNLLAETDDDAAIEDVLEKVRDYFGGARAYIFEFDFLRQITNNTYEVCNRGVTREKDKLQGLSLDTMKYWIRAFDLINYVEIDDVAALAENRAVERQILEAQGISSLVAVPLRRDQQIVGIIGIDDPTRHPSHIGHLQAIGDYIAVMLARRDLRRNVDNERRRLQEFMDDMPGGFVRMRAYPDGKIVPVYANEGFCRMVGMTSGEVLDKYSASAFWGVHPLDRKVVEDAARQIIATGRADSARYRLRTGRGGYVRVMFFGRSTVDDMGDTYLNIFYKDMSEQETREMDLQETLPVVLRAMLSSSSELSFVKDQSLTYLCASDAFARMVGFASGEEIVGKTDFDLFDKPLAEKYRADDRKLMESGISMVDVEEALPSIDGSPRYSRTSKYLLHDPAGQVIGLYGTGRDTTRAKDAYARLNLLANTIPGGLVTYVLSDDGIRTAYFNDGLCRLSGYSREEYEALSRENPLFLLDPDDVAAFTGKLRGLSGGAKDTNFTFRIRGRDGEVKWIALRGAMQGKSGSQSTVNAVLYDITERRHSDEAIRVREEEYRLAIANSGKLVYRYTIATRSLDISPEAAQLFGHPARVDDVPDSLISQGIIAPESQDAYRAFYAAIHRGDKTGSVLMSRRLADASFHWFDARFSTIFDDGGQPASAIILLEDVTQDHEEHVGLELDRMRLLAALQTAYPVAVAVNLTENQAGIISGGESGLAGGSYDGCVKWAAAQLSPEYRQDFVGTFSADSLREAFGRGAENARMEARYDRDGQLSWIEIVALPVRNNLTSDQMGIVLCRWIDSQKAAEDALQKALSAASEELTKERIYQQTMDKSMLVSTVLVRAKDRALLHASGSLFEKYGYSQEEIRDIYRRDLRGFVVDEDYGTAYRDIRLQPDSPVYEQEYRVRKKNGGTAWLYEKGTLSSLEGEDVYIIVRIEATRRREAEEKLRISEEEMRLAMAQMGRMVCEYDVSSRVLTVSPAYAARHGTPDVLENIPCRLLAGDRLDADGKRAVEEFFSAIFRGDASGKCEMLIRCGDGVARWERAEFATIPDRTGAPVKAIITVVDVTDLRNREDETEALRENEQVLEIAATHSNRQVYRYDIATRTAYGRSNDAASAEEILREMPESLIRTGKVLPESVNDVRRLFAAIHSGVRDGSGRAHIKLGDGTLRWVDIRYSLIRPEQGEPTAAVLSMLDITENHEKELAYDRYLQTIGNEADAGALAFFEADVTGNQIEKQGGTSALLSDLDLHSHSRRENTERLIKKFMAWEERKRCREFFSREHLITEYADGNHSLSADWSVQFRDGRHGYVRSILELVQDPYTDHIKAYTLFRDISEEKAAENEVRRLAEIDGMTGLLNKSTSMDQIRRALAESDNTPCALLVADLDNLKVINDGCGHSVGDEAIRMFAGLLRAQVRQSDIVGKIGGDEFVAFLSGCGDENRLDSILTSFMRKLEDLGVGPDKSVPICGSVGVAIRRTPDEDYDLLFSRADKALYHVKRNGKHDYAIYTPAMEEATYRFPGHSTQGIPREQGGYNSLLRTLTMDYTMMMCVNLTDNSYIMLQNEAYPTKLKHKTGVFDELILEGEATFHPDDRAAFLAMFRRDNLFLAHARGSRRVILEGRQMGSDGVYRRVRTEVIFVDKQGHGDLMEITLAKVIDGE